jgi:protein TonB
MKLVISNLNLKIEYSLMTSVLLHGGILLFAIFGIQHQTSQSALPLGTELAYVDLAEASVAPARMAVQTVTLPRPSASEAVSKDDVTEESNTESPAAITQDLSGVAGQGQQAGATSGREGVANGSEVSPEARYLYELKKLLERKKVYPKMARTMGFAGIVRLEFTLGREGEVQSLRVLQGTHPVLDEAAQKLVRSIEKQKPFPQEIARAQWTIEVPIEYSLR